MDSLFEFVRRKISPKCLANELIALMTLRLGKPARKRSNGTKISIDTQRNHLERIVFLLESVQRSQTPVVHLTELNKTHLSLMLDSLMARVSTVGTIDNWLSSFNRLVRDLKLHPLQVSSKTLRLSLELGHRRRACIESKSPQDDSKIEMALTSLKNSDANAAAIFSLLIAVPLRVREAMCLNIVEARNQSIELQKIHLTKGCKNGRPRWVPIWRPDQVAVLEKICPLVNEKHGSLIPAEYDLASYLSYFYRTVRKAGVKKSLGLNCHALRHRGLQDLFTFVTGLPPPIHSVESMDLKQNDLLLEEGYFVVTKAAGHSDPTKASSYLGSKRIARAGLQKYLTKINRSSNNQ
jgi:integrase